MTLTVEKSDAGERLDKFLSEKSELSRSAAAALAQDGKVSVNGKTAGKKTVLSEGDEVTLEIPKAEEIDALPEDIPLDVVYEDGDIIVINKPTGMVVHPAPGNEHGTLVNALLYHCKDNLSGINGKMRPGIVHRIDKDTSGLLVVAKNDAAHRALAAQLEGHHIEREYHALVIGGFSTEGGTVNAPIGRHPIDRKKMAVLGAGEGTAREAITHYRVIERYGQYSYVTCRLETGRTHQIRVHMAYTGHPLLGDGVYGGGGTAFERRHPDLFHGQMLHAARLSFVHPTTGETVVFECPLPDYFVAARDLLRKDAR